MIFLVDLFYLGLSGSGIVQILPELLTHGVEQREFLLSTSIFEELGVGRP